MGSKYFSTNFSSNKSEDLWPEFLDECLEPGLVLGIIVFWRAADDVGLCAALWRVSCSDVLPGSTYS